MERRTSRHQVEIVCQGFIVHWVRPIQRSIFVQKAVFVKVARISQLNVQAARSATLHEEKTQEDVFLAPVESFVMELV